MKTICLYFEIHQIIHLKRYRCFDIGRDHYYYDDYEKFEDDNEEINLYDSAYESLEPVDSSCFSSVGYDSSLGLLWVEFWNTGIYYYEDLSYNNYLDFISADSLGGYYNDYIKGQYPCGKLEE